MKVTDYIAKYLLLNGVHIVFGYQGSSIAHMIDSVSRCPGLQFVETRHEQGAAFAANGVALAGEKLGVAISCSGPGALNLVTGIADAWYDSLPCLFVTGQVSQKEMKCDPNIRQCGFQETEVVSIVSPITKYAVSIESVEDVPFELKKAITIAISGRKGPVLIDIPHNIQGAQIQDDLLEPVGIPLIDSVIPSRIERLINKAKRPVLLIGGGCSVLSEYKQQKLENIAIPVVTSYRGKTNIDNRSSVYCGTIGAYGERYANWAIKYSDLVICLGSRLDGRQTLGEPLQLIAEQNILVCDIDEYELRKYPENYTRLLVDAECLIDYLIDNIVSKDAYMQWLNTIKLWKTRYPVENEYVIEKNVNPNIFLKKLSELLDDNANITVDVGQNQLWANTSLMVKRNQRLIQSCGLGSMGFALPAAIGAYLSNKKQTVCISGDGGIQMNSQEMQTVVQNNIPLKIFVLNNNCLGLIRDYQSKALKQRYYGSIIGFSSPNYELLAKAYGFKYVCITSQTDFVKLDDIWDDADAYFVEVQINQNSTSCPEPTYNASILDQSMKISEEEKMRIEEEADVCR